MRATDIDARVTWVRYSKVVYIRANLIHHIQHKLSLQPKTNPITTKLESINHCNFIVIELVWVETNNGERCVKIANPHMASAVGCSQTIPRGAPCQM